MSAVEMSISCVCLAACVDFVIKCVDVNRVDLPFVCMTFYFLFHRHCYANGLCTRGKLERRESSKLVSVGHLGQVTAVTAELRVWRGKERSARAHTEREITDNG